MVRLLATSFSSNNSSPSPSFPPLSSSSVPPHLFACACFVLLCLSFPSHLLLFEHKSSQSCCPPPFLIPDISSGDFVCDNSESIDERLRCDGYNNCGDWSDERSCTFLTWPWKVAFIVGGCGLGLVIAVVIFAHVIRRRNSRAAHNALTRAVSRKPN